MYHSALISREQIQALHSQLAAVSASDGLVSPTSSHIRQQKPEDHDYMNDDMVAKEKLGHDYINQDVIDKAMTDGKGRNI